MNREMKFSLCLTFDPTGILDREELEANINRIMQYAVSEGLVTPDREDFAALIAWDVTPA